jgi:Domain of unknown function (DUF1906)
MREARKLVCTCVLVYAGCVTEPAADLDPITGVPQGAPRAGVDYSWGRPSPSVLAASGYTFASRYLSYDTTGKNISAGEAQALHDAGIDVVLNWESSAAAPLGGYSTGVAHATHAVALAAEVGAPASLPIYFSVDFDVTAAQFAAVDAYFDGVAAILPVERIGAYGGIRTIAHLFDRGRITYGWQTYAWSGGQWDPRAQVRQVDNGLTIDGAAVDLDVALADDFGQWSAAGPAATVSTFTECGWLHIGEVIGTDRALPSCDGRYLLAQQADGNLVLYRSDGTPLWASDTVASGGTWTVMQGDGNLVAYTSSSAPVWASGTNGSAGAELAVQTDGNVVLYVGDTPIWATWTNE